MRLFAVTTFALALLGRTNDAHARRGGIVARGCGACHGETSSSTVAVTADRATIAPGDLVTLTVTITRPSIAVGGVFVADPGSGQLSVLAGEGLALNSSGLTHTAPKQAQGGAVTFRFGWRAPAQPGATRFEVWALGGNGDGTSGGDAPGATAYAAVYGCTPQQYYFDADGDGFGATLFPSTLGCTGQPPLGYAATNDDCDDTRDAAHPGARELCNGRDDNCNGSVDEGTAPQQLYPDEDGDGYYGSKSGPSVVGCLPLAGYAAEAGDCAPLDASRHPGAIELCNQLDDNCDGRVDERVRPQCGVGWCRRESVNCNVQDCIPGVPSAELCDLLDNDCDGAVDEDGVCGNASGGNTGSGGGGRGGNGGGNSSGGISASGGATTTTAAGATAIGGRPPVLAGGSSAGGNTAAGNSQTTGHSGDKTTQEPSNPEATCSFKAAAEPAKTSALAWLLLALGRLRRRARPGDES